MILETKFNKSNMIYQIQQIYHDLLRNMILKNDKNSQFACTYTKSIALFRESFTFIPETFAEISRNYLKNIAPLTKMGSMGCRTIA